MHSQTGYMLHELLTDVPAAAQPHLTSSLHTAWCGSDKRFLIRNSPVKDDTVPLHVEQRATNTVTMYGPPSSKLGVKGLHALLAGILLCDDAAIGDDDVLSNQSARDARTALTVDEDGRTVYLVELFVDLDSLPSQDGCQQTAHVLSTFNPYQRSMHCTPSSAWHYSAPSWSTLAWNTFRRTAYARHRLPSPRPHARS